MRRWGWVCLVAALVAACGKKNNPAGPSNTTTTVPPSATVVSLALAPVPDLMFLNGTQALTATATLSNGTTSVVSPRWTVEPAALGNVLNNTFTAFASGEGTITAEHEGARASVSLRVVPNVDGQWDANFSITTCTATLDFRGGCDNEELHKLYRFGFVFAQNRDSLTGPLNVFTDLSIPGTGSIAKDGQISMAGSAPFSVNNVQLEYRVENWKSRTSNNVTMTGSFEVVLVAPKFQGEVRWLCEMPTATRLGNRVTLGNGPTSTRAGRPRPSPPVVR